MPRAFTRRQLIKTALAAPLPVLAGSATAAAPSRPNILFILADDFGYADLSCYGRPDYATPNIDRLAAQGIRFTQAYANSAVCTASRVALLTGRYQYRLPIGLEEPLNGRPVGLPPSHPTIPSLLKKAGYATALVGKWHLGELPNYGPGKAATITSLDSAAARSTTSRIRADCLSRTPRTCGKTTSRCTVTAI